jgi:anti-anti-sigma factor
MPNHLVPETTVVVSGPLEGSAVDRWRRLIADAMALQPARLVIDLRDSSRIDAAAIVLLLQAHRTMVCADGQLVLRAPVAEVRRMLQLARIDHVLDFEEPTTPQIKADGP